MRSPEVKKGASRFARKRFILPQVSYVCQGWMLRKTERPVGSEPHVQESK
jgi:hypothetical protein